MQHKYNKYGNHKVVVNGERFDSKKECKRWCELCLLQRAGEISELKRQVPFQLIPALYELQPRFSEKNGKRLKDKQVCVEQGLKYIADFVYKNKDGNTVVEDTKGVKTADYIIKRKLMLWLHKIRIKEV